MMSDLSMIVIPAIHIRLGQLVRLHQGHYDNHSVFEGGPLDAARKFIAAGATRLHVVDLDAARGISVPESTEAVARIVDTCVCADCEVQVAGGVREVDDALAWFNAGASLVVIGSVAARRPDVAEAICEAADGHVLFGLDLPAGVARAPGWTEDGLAATELLRMWRGWRAAGLVYTDTTRESLMVGPNLDGLRTCRELYPGPVYLSGGIGSLADIAACAAAGAAGVVVGKAFHDGRLDLAASLGSGG